MRRIIATGSRHWRDYQSIQDGLRHVARALSITPGEKVTLVLGGQESKDNRTGERYGADYLCARAAESFWWTVEEHPADWDKDGRAAGPIRNQKMVDLGADGGIAFIIPALACKGTRDCVARMERKLIPILVWPGEESV